MSIRYLTTQMLAMRNDRHTPSKTWRAVSAVISLKTQVLCWERLAYRYVGLG